MRNPYATRPDHTFWRRAVAIAPDQVDPVVAAKITIAPNHRVATAGSCFAQHISRALMARGFNYLVTETGPEAEGYGVFPARFGNIYSVRQLRQLFRRAYGLFDPIDEAWVRPDGALVDPFRPQVATDGFADLAALRDDRESHLAAVRAMFEGCDIFIFTLGLTEAWVSARDGAVFPMAPGVVALPPGDGPGAESVVFHNFTAAEMTADLRAFIADLRVVNPNVGIILTVSPVSLIATYEDRHVLVSTIASKSALRVVADEVTRDDPGVGYFPSFEIITGHHTGYGYFEADLRQVSARGVEAVMALFARHCLTTVDAAAAPPMPEPRRRDPAAVDAEFSALQAVICDEEAIEK